MKTHDRSTHEALRQIPYGLYILGVGNHGDVNAMAASWVTQCSFDPPLLMVAVRKGSRTYDLIQEGGKFTLNLIDKKHRDIIQVLEKPFHMVGDKIRQVSHSEDDTGAPVLEQAFAYIECEVRDIYEPGDHAIVIGEVIHAELREQGDPIMCSDLKWHYGG
jgi:flavin reductase (DIM6/NTAB) family NADH-FMN oxidoreductase RutF